MGYLYLKALHIFFVTSWFAGLFYLPRLFVNLAMVQPGDEYQRLLIMARKLYRFMMPLSLMSMILGVWLWLGFGFAGGWLHAKLTLVLVLLGYQHYCGRIYRDFAAGRNQRSHVWFRVFNEIPTFILLAIVILVVVKPF
ncbi:MULTISPECIES: CopD family protein [unclassified Paludibacterium]|uniref:CopD family protein n=1 Tax=unclassified Paludibacterium TaxID=2618429 RepID=UPI001C049C25|nr:CopD family protein [Paludibacterium sp. B53371]BEV72771.1 protoporphyrinogen oxidase HemJ [Paludibacterium sp. THUN1379]